MQNINFLPLLGAFIAPSGLRVATLVLFVALSPLVSTEHRYGVLALLLFPVTGYCAAILTKRILAESKLTFPKSIEVVAALASASVALALFSRHSSAIFFFKQDPGASISSILVQLCGEALTSAGLVAALIGIIAGVCEFSLRWALQGERGIEWFPFVQFRFIVGIASVGVMLSLIGEVISYRLLPL